jgi:hypothetical protein
LIAIKLADTENVTVRKLDSGTLEEAKASSNKKMEIGSILMTLGPVLVSLGVLGIVSEHWEGFNKITQLTVIYSTLLILNGVALFFKLWDKERPEYQNNSETLFFISYLAFAPTLYLTFRVLEIQFSQFYSEFFGFWFLSSLPYIFILKNKLVQNLANLVGFAWLFGLTSDLIFNKAYENVYNLFLLFSSSFALLTNNILTFNKQDDSFHKNSAMWMYILTGYLVLIPAGMPGTNSFLAIFGLYLATGILIALKYFGNFWLKSPFINLILAVFAITTAFVAGAGMDNTNMFLGFFFLKGAYIIWLLDDYINLKVNTSKDIFYVIGGLILLISALNTSLPSLLELGLLVGLIAYFIFRYKPESQNFSLYVWIAIIVSIMSKLISFGYKDPSWLVLILGSFFMIAGSYFAYISDKNKKKSDNTTDSKKAVKSEEKAVSNENSKNEDKKEKPPEVEVEVVV